MEGTVTVNSETSTRFVIGNGRGEVVVADIVLDGSGNVSGGPIPVQAGFLTDVEVVSGDPAPTTGYTLQLLSDNGADLLGDDGLAIASATPQRITKTPAMVSGSLFPTIAGAGAGAKLTLHLYLMGL